MRLQSLMYVLSREITLASFPRTKHYAMWVVSCSRKNRIFPFIHVSTTAAHLAVSTMFTFEPSCTECDALVKGLNMFIIFFEDHKSVRNIFIYWRQVVLKKGWAQLAIQIIMSAYVYGICAYLVWQPESVKDQPTRGLCRKYIDDADNKYQQNSRYTWNVRLINVYILSSNWGYELPCRQSVILKWISCYIGTILLYML